MKGNVISCRLRTVVHFCIALSVLALLFYTFFWISNKENVKVTIHSFVINKTNLESSKYNVWLIFTKVGVDSPLRFKFRSLIRNLVNVTSVPLNFHIIVDLVSQEIASTELRNVTYTSVSHNKILWYFYSIDKVAKRIHDIVGVLTPHFSSKPGTYYSDALFYISLGLHRIAPPNQDLAVILDCDLYFKDDMALLFKEFARFKSSALFGMAPELTPVYRHVLHTFRSKHNTTFGDFYHSAKYSDHQVHPRGFQGYNSGVVLLNLNKIRKSKEYPGILSNNSINQMTAKYQFRGHLGDQDFYTLLGFEYPDLIQTLHCGFNRQLCTWWKTHGYNDVFDKYFKCDHKIIILHGNCNTRIPKL